MKCFVQLLFLLCLVCYCVSLATPIVDNAAGKQYRTTINSPSTTGRSYPNSLRWYSSLLKWLSPSFRTQTGKGRFRHANASSSPRYNSDVLLRFTLPDDDGARKAFADAVETMYLDVWAAKEDWVDLRIAKDILPAFLTLLPPSMQRSHRPLLTDLSKAVLDTYPDIDGGGLPPNIPGDLFFENYQPLSVIYPWLTYMASMYPDRAELFSLGTSHEERDIPAFRVGLPSADENVPGPRHTILIVAGAHAREWISVSTAVYILREFISDFSETTTKIMTHYDIVFVPVINPDGYEFTWTTDRLWRKTRQETPLPFCPGIDLDRSFPYSWDGDSQIDNPCSESYAGRHPLEAVEAQRLVDWATNETADGNRFFSAFIDLHSYSQQILYPYSYTCDRVPYNIEDLEEIAIGLAKAFRLTSGQNYGVSSACDADYASTDDGGKKNASSKTSFQGNGGSLLDYVFATLGVRYSFQVKLRDTGSYGFLLPKDNIVPTGREAFEAVLGLGRWLLGNRGIESFSTQDAFGVEEIIKVPHTPEVELLEDEGDRWWDFRRRRR